MILDFACAVASFSSTAVAERWGTTSGSWREHAKKRPAMLRRVTTRLSRLTHTDGSSPRPRQNTHVTTVNTSVARIHRSRSHVAERATKLVHQV
ncbi:hypothetical protein ACZ90_63600 [Streptomyces albus subsp. albus]|nr:hypothetical protein ACZ90_63600 [Streptomyces albus subsp. albus]